MEIPFQDALVYDELDDEKSDRKPVEKLLPEPEKALERPAAKAPENAQNAQKHTETLEPAQSEEATAMADQPAEALLPDTDQSDIQQPVGSDETTGTEMVDKAPHPETKTTAEQPKAKKTADQVIADLANSGSVNQAQKTTDPMTETKDTQTVTQTGGEYVIQFGAVRDRAAAVAEFDRLQSTYPNLIGSLDQRIQRADLGDKGIFYRIQGGFLTKTAAQDICNQLQDKHSVSCLVKQK
jgi:hypothetical protein